MPDITRKELYEQFSPILLEAITLIVKDEINILRSQVGLPERTNQQLMNSIVIKLESLDSFDWE